MPAIELGDAFDADDGSLIVDADWVAAVTLPSMTAPGAAPVAAAGDVGELPEQAAAASPKSSTMLELYRRRCAGIGMV
jgi:hypothetical protein